MTKTGDKLRFVPLSRKKKGCPLSVWLSREGGREKKDGPSAPDLQSARRRRGVQDFHTMFEQVPGVNQGDPLSLPAAQRVDPAQAALDQAWQQVFVCARHFCSRSSLPRVTHRPKNVIV